MSDQSNILTTETADVLAGQDYYRNLVEAKEKGPMYDQMRNQSIVSVIDAGKNIAKNEVNALQQYESSKYQAAQTIDKSGWSGGYALDTERQLSYMRESIQADILSQKDLQKLGYKSALGQAIAATELQADQLALDRYRQARQDAEYTSQLTGRYVEPHIADMATQVSALSTLIEKEQEGSPNKAKYEATLKTLQSKLSEIVSRKNQELKAQGADYSFGKLDEQGNFISVTGIKTLAQIQRDSQLRTEELQRALLEEDIEVKKVEAATKKADLYEKKDAQGNVMRDAEGNVMYGSYSADREAKMDEASILDTKLGIDIKKDQLRKNSYDPTTGSVIPVFNEDGTIKSYTNAVPTTKEEFEELKSYFAENPTEFNRFFNNTLSQLKSGMSEGDDFGTYFANTFSNINLKAIIDKYEPKGESFSMGGVTFKKVEQDDQEVMVGETKTTVPKDSWVIIDDKTGSGYCYYSVETEEDGVKTVEEKTFSFKQVVKEPGGEDDDGTPQPNTSSHAKGSYGTGLDKSSKNNNYNEAIKNDFYASPDGRTHYVTLRGTDSKPVAAVSGEVGYIYIYATAQAAEGSKPTGAMNARVVEATIAAGSPTIVITDDKGAQIPVGRVAKVDGTYWVRQQNGWSQIGLINDTEEAILKQIAIKGTKVDKSGNKREARMQGAEAYTLGDTAYKVTSKERGYAVSDKQFNGTNVNYATITLVDGSPKPKWVDVRILDGRAVKNDKQPGELFFQDGIYYISKDKETAFPIVKHTDFGNDFNKEEYDAFLAHLRG